MKRRFALTSVLVTLAMVLAPVTTFAAPPAQPAQNGDEGPGWETWTEDASCEELFGFVGVALWDEEDEPAEDVPVTFTWNGSDFGPYYTNEDGVINTLWAYTPGQGEVTVGISAEGWGYMEVTFGGPDECEGAPVPSVEVSWACGQEAPSVTLAWSGEFDGMDTYIVTEGDERYDWTEGNSLTFEELIPGATYYYVTYWWIGEWESWGFTEGYFTVPEECTQPQPEAELTPQYWLVDIYNPVPHDGWLDYCFAIMPQGYVPTDEWRGQPNHCGWTGGRVVHEGWVSLDEAGNPHYGGPGWKDSYYNPDYTDLYHNLETWNQDYLDSVQ